MVSLSQDARGKFNSADVLPATLAAAPLVVALGFLFAPLWAVLWQEWWKEESAYSHGVLIPFLTALMLWWRQDTWRGLKPRPALSGVVPLLLGLALELFGRWAHSTMIQWAAFLMVAVAGAAFVLGWRLTLRLLPPILYLTFMVPLSAMLTQPVIVVAQVISTHLADGLLKLTGFHTDLQGTFIVLDNYKLQVAVACSGFKTLIALMAFSCCLIYLMSGSAWKKGVLLVAAPILAMLVNGLRISLVGVTGELIGSSQATWVHDNGGLPVAALALGALFLMARMMKCSLTAPA